VISKPMLAAKATSPEQIKFPVLATPKLDGIRCLKVGGRALTRKFKPIPNNYVRKMIEYHCLEGFDGELISGKTFNECQSNIMSIEGEPEFRYVVFDYVPHSLNEHYEQRVSRIIEWPDLPLFVQPLIPVYVSDLDKLVSLEAQYIEMGYEGIIVRSPDGPYKCGRATLREGYLTKLKRFDDSEAVVLGFKELMHNANEAEVDNLGYTKRSSSKEGKIPAGRLGKMWVRDIYSGVEFSISSKDHAMSKEVWANQDKYMGAILKYKFQPAGAKEKPRFPVFLGWRHPDDMS